jgi:hypothetical protein
MVLIYSISGIALNHLHQWNPNYIISRVEVQATLPSDTAMITKDFLSEILMNYGEKKLLSHYYPKKDELKAFVPNGSLTLKLSSGQGVLEKIQRRPFFKELNFLHYNKSRKWWTWFSDFFAVSLIAITITGLFILKGRNGITRRGAVLVIAGLILPILALIVFS